MEDPNKIESVGLGATWFIEDMSLFSTTVRLARTNEVASISNASIAQLRIVNGNRSPDAIVVLHLSYKLALIDDHKLSSLRSCVASYIKQYPNEWSKIIYCRVKDIDYAAEKVEVSLSIQSRHAWQDLGRIAKNKALLKTAIYEFGRDTKLIYEELPHRKLVFNAGVLKDGATTTNRSALHHRDNILANRVDGEKATTSECDKDTTILDKVMGKK